MMRVEYFEMALIGTLIALVGTLSAIYIIGID